MTQEEKAKRYDEVKNKLSRFIAKGVDPLITRADVQDFFPELKESEDDEIRRWIINELKIKHHHLDEENVDFVDKAIAWLEKQGESYTKRDVDDAYLEGVASAKNEIEKQHEANCQIRKDIATFIFNYKGDIKDRAKWMEYLGIKASFVEKQGEKPQGKSALESIKEEKVDNANKVEPKDYSSIDPHYFKPTNKVVPKFKVKFAGNEYNVLEVKDSAGTTFYGIEDEPNHIDYIRAENCEMISGYGINDNGSPYPTETAVFSEQKSAWSEEYIADVFEKVGLAKIVREQSNDALTIALQDAMIELSKVTLQQKPA